MTLIRNTLATAVATALMLTSLAAHADKKADVQKILTLQQPALEDMARSVAERPAPLSLRQDGLRRKQS
mgnify:CR=1 FL=1